MSKREILTQEQCENTVLGQMTAWADLRKFNPAMQKMHETLDEFLLKNGKMYTKRGELPKFAKIMPKTKECYFNAYGLRRRLAAQGRTLHYAEGYVMHESFIIPVMHGWLVDENGEVLDTSIEKKGAIAYYGVTFKHEFTDAVWTKLRLRSLIGILGNAWILRLKPEDLKKELTHSTDPV